MISAEQEVRLIAASNAISATRLANEG